MDILHEYESAKARSQSRPVRTAHGNTAEAIIRRWLENTLPFKYAVTSGFIIPSIIAETEYRLYHYDVIVFDKLNAPILWVDTNPDESEQGKKRAIPAKYVRCVFEIKSRFNAKQAQDALQKLGELNDLKDQLSPSFTSSIIFIELAGRDSNRFNMLSKLCPKSEILGYWGGMILKYEHNTHQTGIFNVFEHDAKTTEIRIALAKNLDRIGVYLDEHGNPIITEQGAGIIAYNYGGRWHPIKTYGPTFKGEKYVVDLRWSYDNFARFVIDLLLRLDGEHVPCKPKHFFGRCFDILTPLPSAAGRPVTTRIRRPR